MVAWPYYFRSLVAQYITVTGWGRAWFHLMTFEDTIRKVGRPRC